MKIVYAYEYDANNPRMQSTRPFSILEELKRRFDVVPFFPVPNVSRKIMAPRKLYYMAGGRHHHLEREWLSLKEYAWRVARIIEKEKPDLVFSPSQIIPTYLDTGVPTIYCTDAPFGAMLDFYPSFSNLSKTYRRQVFVQEREAHRHASRIIYPSAWARQAAIDLHEADPTKCIEQAFGANLPYLPEWTEVRKTIAPRASDSVNLLLISSDWERKGGEFAINIIRELHHLNINAKLQIMGRNPSIRREEVVSLGYIDKWSEEGAGRFRDAMLGAHFIIMPSDAEAYGMSLWEGAAHGLPMIGRAVGGITSIIRHNETGMLFPADATAGSVAQWIQGALRPENYNRLSEAAYADYRARGNWRVFVDKIFGS